MAKKAKNDKKAAVRKYELAGLVNRFAAYVIDSLLMGLLTMLVFIIIGSAGHRLPVEMLKFIVTALPVAYYWYFWTRRDGQTPGKFAVGIRVIRSDGAKLSDVDALMRAIGYHISSMLFGLGFVWALFDKKNQTWHDKIARTYVVRDRKRRKTVTIPL